MRDPIIRKLETTQLPQREILERQRMISRALLEESAVLDAANFTQFHPRDLERMFELYDDLFFEGHCRQLLGETPLSFRISSRMTSAGGKTTRLIHRDVARSRRYEITISSTLLFQTFRDVQRAVTVTGIECRSRLEAMQRIFEHELVHLLELLVWDVSSCSAGRFQSIAARYFGHTDHRHVLVTPRERAFKRFGFKTGSHVCFSLDGVKYVGIVNRITQRATVLVEDRRGERYSNGRHYLKFYVPLEMLRPATAAQ